MPQPKLEPPHLSWDIFCRVIDNWGDAGVCCRLTRELARRGHRVRLFCDDLTLARRLLGDESLTPGCADILAWLADDDPFWSEPVTTQVVIEAFACDPPPAYLRRLAQSPHPPIWINLEYLSAESWVERVHGLPSPQWQGPGAGLTKWFFHPGFSLATGGLSRELDLTARQTAFDAPAWLAQNGVERRTNERVVSLFCYEQPMLQILLEQWADASTPTLLLTTPGWATEQAQDCLWPAGVRWQALPWLSQNDYDHLLWSCDLNLVRGEDSLTRALWAEKPFLWQLYPQSDGAHLDKARAFLKLLPVPQGAPNADLSAWWLAWNADPASMAQIRNGHGQALWTQGWADWQAEAQSLSRSIRAQPDLATQLLDFVGDKANGARAHRPC